MRIGYDEVIVLKSCVQSLLLLMLFYVLVAFVNAVALFVDFVVAVVVLVVALVVFFNYFCLYSS